MIKILIASEHTVVREGLKQIVAGSGDMVVAGEASSGQEVLDKVLKNYYDVVLLDISPPDRSALDALKELKSQRPNLPVLILSMHPEEQYAVRAFRAGASGYLTIGCAPDELITALRKVLRGGKYISSSLAERLAFNLERGLEKLPHELLSDREYQVMCLIASGKTVSEIADELWLSVKTISTYRSRILEKMNLRNNAELVRYYARFCADRSAAFSGTVPCKNCGQDNAQEAGICVNCGAALVTAAETPAAAVSPRPELRQLPAKLASFWSKYRWPVVALAIAVIAAGVAGWQVQRSPTTAVVTTEGLELRYDDGTAEGYVSPHWGGYLVSFSPPATPFIINKIKVCGVTWGTGWEGTEFELQIWDKEQEVLHSASYPFTLFPSTVSPVAAQAQYDKAAPWIEVAVPDIEVETDFFIHVYAGTVKGEGIHLGSDDSLTNKHSDLTVLATEGVYKIRDTWPYPKDMWFADKSKVNWMIRVIGQAPE